MSAFYRIVEWDRYQHYKDRDPPWIKLHRDTLTSRTWVNGDDRARVLAVACMLIAAGTDNRIPADTEYLKRRAYLNKDPDFAPLVASGFVELVRDDNAVADASKPEQMLASGTECSSEREERQRRGEEEDRAFAMFVVAAKRNNRPEPSKLTDDRRKKLRARLDEHGIDGWEKMLDLSDASEFLNKTFPLKIDWVLEPRNFRKIIEGNYVNGTAASGAQKNGAARSEGLPPAEPWEQRMQGWCERKQWLPMVWGPPPGESGCRVPAALAAKHRGTA